MDLNFRPLRADEIEVRVGSVGKSGASLLLYKDARVDMKLLDEVVGPFNWKREHSRENANCTVSIYDDEKKEWVSKEDTGTQSFTEAEKGLASDSFKRACFNWGIGRELYTAPFIWIPASDINLEPKDNGRFTTYDTFTVKEIGYSKEGVINNLVIWNNKKKKIVYTLGSSAKEDKVIGKKEVEIMKAMCDRKGVPNSGYNGKKLEALTSDEYAEALRRLEAMPDKV